MMSGTTGGMMTASVRYQGGGKNDAGHRDMMMHGMGGQHDG